MADNDFFKALDAIANGVRTNPLDAKKATVAEASEMKKTRMNPDRIVAAIRNDTDFSHEGSVADFADLSNLEYLAKYGETRADVGYSDAANTRLQRMQQTRSLGEKAGDAVFSVGQSFYRLGEMAGGVIQTLGEYLPNPDPNAPNLMRDLGRFLREGSERSSEIMEGGKSFAKQERNTLYDLDRAVENEDSKFLMDKEIASGGGSLKTSIMAGLERVGRDLLNNTSAVVSNPDRAFDLLTESLPSLVLTAGGTTSVARAMLGSSATQAQVREAATRLVPAFVGAMEGSDTAAGIFSEVSKIADTDLMQMSPEYAALRESGMSEADAKSRIAAEPALTGALVQGIIGLASGKINAGFEAAPLAGGLGLGSLAKSMGSEAVEEAIQGGSQTLTTNTLMQSIDPDREITEGVGRALAESAVAGGLMPAATRGPGAAVQGAATGAGVGLKGAVGGVKLAAKGVAAGAGAVASMRTQKADEQVASENQQAEAEALPVEDGTVEALKSPVKESLVLDDESFDAVFTDNGKESLKDSKRDAFSLTNKLLDEYRNAPEEAKDALTADINSLRIFLEKTAQELGAKADDETATQEELDDFLQITDYTDTVKNSDSYKDAVQRELKRVQGIEQPTASDAVNIASLADIDPVNMSEETLTKALDAAKDAAKNGDAETELEASRKRPLRATADTIAKLSAALNIKKIVKYYEDATKVVNATPDAGNRNRTSMVSANIMYQGFESGNGYKRSLIEYARDIKEALNMGDTEYANDIAIELMDFQIVLASKLKALHESAVNAGSKEEYISASNKEFFSSLATETGSTLTLYGNKQGSIDLYKYIYNDAVATTAFINTLIEENPSLGLNPAAMPSYSKSVAQHESKNAAYEAARDAMVVGLEGPIDGMPTERPLKTKRVKEADRLPSLKRRKEMRREAGNGKPLINYIISRGGVNPNSDFADWLKARGFEKRDAPGLIRAGSELRMDAIGIDTDNTYLSQMIGDDGNGYLDPDGLFEAIMEEIAGNPQYVRQEQAEIAAALETIEAEAARREAENPTKPRKRVKKTKTQEPTDETGDNADTTEEAEKPPKLADRFPRLAQTAEGVLHLAERFNFNPSSIWKNEKGIVDYIINNMPKNHQRDMAAVVRTAQDLSTGVKERVAAQLKKHEGGKYLNEANLDAGIDFYDNGRGARHSVIMEKQEDGSWALNEELLNAASMAAVEWLSKVLTTNPKSAEQVAKGLGLDEHEIDRKVVNILNSGSAGFLAKNELGKLIQKFWGITPKADTRSGDALAESIADTLLRVMEDKGMMTTQQVKIRDTDTTYQVIYTPNINETYKEHFVNQYGVMTELFTDAREKVMHFGKPVERKNKSPFRHKSRSVRMKALETKATNRADQVVYNLNIPFFGFIEKMAEHFGDNIAAAKIFGYRDLKEEDQYNRNHYASIEGKNRSILQGMANIKKTVDGLKEHAKTEGVEVSKAKLFFEHVINNVGRMQQLGLVTPQANKIMRETMVSTWADLDLTKDEHSYAFWLTVGQMSDLKFGPEGKTKVEYLKPEIARESIETTVRTKFGDLAKLFKDQALSGDTEFDAQSFYDQVMAVTDGEGLTPMQVHSIMALGRYDAAFEQGTQKTFRHGLALEADGVTNGPAGVFFKFRTDGFSKEALQMYERIGIFFTQKQKNLHNRSVKDDMYEYNAAKLKPKLNAHHAVIRKGEARTQLEALERFISVFSPKGLTVKMDEQDAEKRWELDRNAVKNPLTQIIYGAGAKGVANGLVGVAMSGLYEKMSDYLQNGNGQSFNEFIGYPGDIRKDLALLIGGRIGASKDGGFKVYSSKVNFNFPTNLTELSKFKLNKWQFDALANNMTKLYVEPMHQTVQESLGTSYDTMQTFIKSSQVMNKFFRFKYEAAEKAYRKAHNIRVHDMLSTKDRLAIIKSVEKFMPLVETEDQDFDLSSLVPGISKYEDSKGELRSRESSQAIGEPGGYASYDTKIGDIGVSAAPNLNIGTGDGLMMIHGNAALTEDINRVLSVYDGQNMPADAIKEISEIMNKAVYEAWNTNTAAEVHSAFRSFLRVMDAREMKDWLDSSPDIRIDLANTLGMERIYADRQQVAPGSGTVMMEVRNLEKEMAENAIRIQAIMNVRRSVSYSTDQMAGASSSYVSEGDTLPAENAVEFLNQRAREEYAKLTQPLSQKVKADNARFAQGIEKFTTKLGKYNIHRIKAKHVAKLAGYLNKDQRVLFNRVVEKAVVDSGYEIFLGTPEELERFRKEVQGKDTPNGLADGLFDPNTNSIYLTNQSAETFMHELLHLATAGKVEKHYNDPQEDGIVANAISNLEVLMADYLELDTSFERDGDFVNQARDDLTITLTGIDGNTNLTPAQKKAAKLNEFIAWTLSNPYLARMAKDQTIRNPLVRVYRETVKAVKKLLGLKNVDSGRDYFTAIQFNAQIIAHTENGSTFTALNHNTGKQANARLRDLYAAMIRGIEKHVIDLESKGKLDLEGLDKGNIDETNIILDRLIDYGYTFTSEEAQVFRMTHSYISTAKKFAPASLVQLHQIVDDVLGGLTDENFMIDPETADAATKAHAENLLKVVVGSDLASNSQGKKNDMFPIILALAAVNEDFRQAVNKVKLSKDTKQAVTDIDSALTRGMNYILGSVTDAAVGTRKARTVTEGLDRLTMNIIRYEGEAVMGAEQAVQGRMDQMDDALADRIQGLSGKAYDGLRKLFGTTQQQKLRGDARSVAALGVTTALGLVNKDAGQDWANMITSVLNTQKMPVTIRNLFSSMRGFSEQTADLYAMMNKVKSGIQAVRQEYRIQIPKIMMEGFTTKLDKIHKTAMHTTIGKSDVASLLSAYGLTGIQQFLMNDAKLDGEISKLSSGMSASRLKAANDLAKYMIHDTPASNLQLNAYAISEKTEGMRGDAAEAQIDQLVSLVAIKELPAADKKIIRDLLKTDGDAVKGSIVYIATLRARENRKHDTTIVRMNQRKGYIPSQNAAGTSVALYRRSEIAKMKKLGWVVIDDYQGSSADQTANNLVYMATTTKNMARYVQGIMQTAEQSQNGIDSLTGRQLGNNSVGTITGTEVRRITRRIEKYGEKAKNGEFLRPIYDNDKRIIAYERLIDPAHLVHLNRSTDFFEMSGAWAGRQVEEQLIGEYNKATIKELHRIYTKRGVDADEFENIAKSDDPIFKDAWDSISRETKKEIEKTFGRKQFLPIRRDMIENAVGYRNASVTDLWTGNTRMNNAVRKTAQDIAVALFSDSAFAIMAKSERALQTGVSSIKDLIIVKSLVVPIGNLISNVWQLSMRGVPLTTIATIGPKAFAEINQYLKNREVGIQLQHDKSIATDPADIRRIQARIDTLVSMNRKLSIWPLIEAGEFTTVAEGLTEMDASLVSGRFADWVEQKVDQMPAAAKEFARQGLILRDTALYQGLDRATQYGDFLAKAIYYHHLTENKKVGKKEALNKITQEFINYNLLSGRTQDYLESIGLAWFWKFKLRSIKVAINMMQENPFRVFLHTAGIPFVDVVDVDVDSIITDNAAAKIGTGGVSYSLGWDMGLGAVGLNPWLNGFDYLMGN